MQNEKAECFSSTPSHECQALNALRYRPKIKQKMGGLTTCCAIRPRDTLAVFAYTPFSIARISALLRCRLYFFLLLTTRVAGLNSHECRDRSCGLTLSNVNENVVFDMATLLVACVLV